MTLRTLRPWSLCAGACLVAGVRALTAAPPPSNVAADDFTRRQAFFEIASGERRMRLDAAKKFPTDPWSQDDDFHSAEHIQEKTFAGHHGIRLGDVISAVDDGIREGWTRDPRAIVRTTVPPCQPRAIY